MKQDVVSVVRSDDGWRAQCSCGWIYESTSPSIAESALEFHRRNATVPHPAAPGANGGGQER
jgi:hypothetical protein